MAKMQEFKCPCCGGSIEFDSSVQKMKCPYCDTEFDVKTLSEYAQSVEEEEPEDMSWSDEAGDEWRKGKTKVYVLMCANHVAVRIVGDVNTAADCLPVLWKSCSYDGKSFRVLKPDYDVPFKLD